MHTLMERDLVFGFEFEVNSGDELAMKFLKIFTSIPELYFVKAKLQKAGDAIKTKKYEIYFRN